MINTRVKVLGKDYEDMLGKIVDTSLDESYSTMYKVKFDNGGTAWFFLEELEIIK